MERKVDKGIPVNVVVDGKEAIAKKRLQVPPKLKNVLHYTFMACKKYRVLDRHHVKVLSWKYHA